MNRYVPPLIADITTPQTVLLQPALGVSTNLDKLLSLELIRTYTKTDDVPHVTNEQLVLYRQAAFEACEQYTGLLFSAQRPVTEDVATAPKRRYRDTYKHRMRYPSSDGIVHFYGGLNMRPQEIHIEPGAQEVRLPIVGSLFGGPSCCSTDPCTKSINYGLKILYKAGLADCTTVPAGIIVGVLKFIAWLISNPGDEILTVRNRKSNTEVGIVGTNNAAWVSGAIEQWRIYVVGAI